MKAFIYVRVSTEEQKKHGLSVDSQLQALQEYCKENNIEVYDVYNDAGRSAHASYKKRKELLRLIQDSQQHKADIILFTRLDRWFRSIEDYYEVMAQIPDDIPWQTIWEDYETVTSSGRFKVNIMLSIAQAEAERTSEKIKDTFEYKRAKGDYVGSAPYGYKRCNNRLVKDEECKHIIDAIFQTYIATHSAISAMRKAREMGSTITKSGVLCMLKNLTYTGDAKGTECEPYITKEQYESIQRIKENNIRTPIGADRTYMFQTLCFCKECGRRIRTFTNVKDGHEYRTYECNGYHRIDHKGFSMSERKIEKYILEHIEKLIDDYNIKAESVKQNGEQLQEIKKKEKALKQKLERIGVRFELGDYSVEEYKEKRLEIQRELDNIPKVESAVQPVSLPNDWRAIYNELDAQHRQEFWFSIIKRIEISQKKDISIFFY